MPTVVPAHGRDYTSKAKAIADWEAGKDFILQDMSSPWDGKPINKEDAKNAGFREVNIRYKNLRQIAVVKVAMTKVASPQDLQAEIHKLITYSEGEQPSRQVLANSLRQLADRVATANMGEAMLSEVVPQRDMWQLYSRLEDEDEQSAKLFYEVVGKLQDELEISSGAEKALWRLKDIVMNGRRWDAALLRNNVFKMANMLGIKLPSGMF